MNNGSVLELLKGLNFQQVAKLNIHTLMMFNHQIMQQSSENNVPLEFCCFVGARTLLEISILAGHQKSPDWFT